MAGDATEDLAVEIFGWAATGDECMAAVALSSSAAIEQTMRVRMAGIKPS